MSGISHYTVLAAARSIKLGNPAIKLTWQIIMEHMGVFDNGDGTAEWNCCPGQDRLAEETEQSVRTVRSQIRMFEELGLLTTEHRSTPEGRKTNVYVLDLATLFEMSSQPANIAGWGTQPANTGDPTGNLLPVAMPLNSQTEQPDALGASDDAPNDPPATMADLPRADAIRLGATYPAAFERAWAIYPSRPNNSKLGAYKAWRKRVEEGRSKPGGIAARAKWLEAATRFYSEWCDENVTVPNHIKQASTFYGPDDPWREFARIASENGVTV